MFDNRCRGKDIQTKMWVPGYHIFDKKHYIVQNLKMIVRGTPELISAYEVDEKTLGRSSRFLDIDDRTVFEGDIVTWADNPHLRYVVRFGQFTIAAGSAGQSCTGFYLDLISDCKHMMPIDEPRCKELRVIGNVIDNPELLERRV